MNRNLFWRISAISLLLVALFLVTPFLSSVSLLGFKPFFANNNSFADTFLRTVLYSFLSAIVLAKIGFWGAIALSKIPFFSKLGKSLSILILPITLGNISIAFIVKFLFGDTAFFATIIEKGVVFKLSFLLLLQMWQYGLLFIYLFWLQFQNISANKLEYAAANHFSFFHTIKDIYLPGSKNLVILTASLGMIFSLYEESKIQYLFKASQGTDSELITNWIGRNYQSYLLVNPQFAADFAFQSGWVIMIFAILILAFLFLLVNGLFYINSKSKTYPVILILPSKFIRKILTDAWAFFLIFIIAIPVVWCLFKMEYKFGFDTFSIALPLLMTFIAATTASVIAIFFGISARQGWKELLSSFNNRSLIFFTSMFLVLLIPPIIILISGYKWMGALGYSSLSLVYTVWVLGHTVLLSLPLLGSFVLFNHFRVTNNELDYLMVYKLTKVQLIKFSFLKRFKAEYLLLFIIGFAFIWNEAILNNLFSDYIPSFVSGLKMLITGRGADYSKAFGYLLVSLLLAVSAVVVWRYIIHKAEQWTTK